MAAITQHLSVSGTSLTLECRKRKTFLSTRLRGLDSRQQHGPEPQHRGRAERSIPEFSFQVSEPDYLISTVYLKYKPVTHFFYCFDQQYNSVFPTENL